MVQGDGDESANLVFTTFSSFPLLILIGIHAGAAPPEETLQEITVNVADYNVTYYVARPTEALQRLLERLAATQSRTAQVPDATKSDWNATTGTFGRSIPRKYLDSGPVKMAFVTGGSDIRFRASPAPDQSIAVPIVLDITPTEVERFPMGAPIRSVVQGPEGTLWVLEDESREGRGRLLKLTPRN